MCSDIRVDTYLAMQKRRLVQTLKATISMDITETEMLVLLQESC